MQTRLTQKELKFGIYVGSKGKEREGVNIWFLGKYVWPRRAKVKMAEGVKVDMANVEGKRW
jgi:hypothetical protein